MTTLCFYQGLRTIGGTVLEIATQQARCLFDFGLVYSPQEDARVLPRQRAMVSDALKLGTLPEIEGLYARTELGGLPLSAYGETEPRPFVLISHMHLDHMGALGLLAPDAHVYMTEDSLKLYKGLTAAGDIEFRTHENVIGVAPMEWQKKGDIAFRMIPVDHDVPGACGFEIVTPDGNICYTGDLRLHGATDANTLLFCYLVRGADLCITEGVTASFIDDFDAVVPNSSLEGVRTEAGLLTEIVSAVTAARGLVCINLYNRNIERLHALHETLQSLGRRLVLEPQSALLYRQFHPSAAVRVYAPLAEGFRLPGMTLTTTAEIQAHPARYALQLSYAHLLETLDFTPEGSLYLHTDGMPLGAYDPGFAKLQQFLAAQGIAYRLLHCGGHASPEHLKYLLTQIAPKTLIPLHSLTPEKIRVDGAKQFLPEAGKRYRLEGGMLR